jgi:hypothetical protein
MIAYSYFLQKPFVLSIVLSPWTHAFKYICKREDEGVRGRGGEGGR